MRSAYLVIALAAVSQAFSFGEKRTQEKASSLLPRSRINARQSDGVFLNACPKPKGSMTEAIVYAPLNTTELALAQAAMIKYCVGGTMINPGTGGNGQLMTAGGVTTQICNLSDYPVPCPHDSLEALFNAIPCGTVAEPTMGLTSIIMTIGGDAPLKYAMSVAYTDTAHVQTCYDKSFWGNIDH
ncbi:MAG: hypothetical protein MMC23_001622 [Stictis urceolatum]|nr:hypothetical protein [Stictis urceolata]